MSHVVEATHTDWIGVLSLYDQKAVGKYWIFSMTFGWMKRISTEQSEWWGSWRVPSNWSSGTPIQVTGHFHQATAGTGDIQFQFIRAFSADGGLQIDTTVENKTVAFPGTASELFSAEFADLTPSAAGEYLTLRIRRNPSSDVAAVDMGIMGFGVKYTTEFGIE